MSALVTDFINIEILAQAVASKIKLETSISKRVFTLDEAAAYCGLTRDGFKKKVVRDRIQKVRLDKCWRFDKADLDAWIDGHKDETTGKAA
jgi:excisionase family DNA binding protein